MLGLKETVDHLAKGNGVGWYRHVLRRGKLLWILSEDNQIRSERSTWKRREDWFKEEVCHESSKMERWSTNYSRKNRMNLATCTKGTIRNKN